jgi:hypothetical protein
MPIQEIPASARIVWVGHSCPTNADSKITQAGNSRRRILPTICAALLALSPYATAQRTAHATAPHPAVHSNVPARSFSGRAAFASRFRRSSPYTSLPFPFFADSFNPDDVYSTGYPVASQPPLILLQAARAVAAPTDYAATEPAIPQPLVIELHNGRYVRVSSTPSNGEALEVTLAPTPAIATPTPSHELPPALLLFRDGHSEEVRDYTIADGILYARGDYYTDGYWNKKIEITSLNVPQTLEANAQRNVKFVLPASPNEVITRP